MKKCPFCGADIEDSARFCLYCMQSLVKKELILSHKKKKPQWVLIIAAIVSIILIFALVLFGSQAFEGNEPPFQGPQLSAASTSDPTGTRSSATEQPTTVPETQSATPEDTQPVPSDTTKPAAPVVPRPTTSAAPQPITPTQPTTPTEPESTTPAQTQPSEPAATSPTEPVTTSPTEPVTTQPSEPVVTDPHEHSFTVKNAISKYLVSEATCTRPAYYAYSCSCGQMGTETFHWGRENDHTLVTVSGYAATCVEAGVKDGNYCTVCEHMINGYTQIKAKGHTFKLGSSAGCISCGEERTITIKTPSFPIVVDNIYQITGGTVNFQLMPDNRWYTTFKFNFKNISSVQTTTSPTVSLWGYAQASNASYCVQPNETGSFYAHVQIDDINGTYTLVFE